MSAGDDVARDGLDGTYFDGLTARPHAVRVARADDGALRMTGDGVDLAIDREARVSPRLARTPRVLRLADGAQVHFADDPRIDAWFPPPTALERRIVALERAWPAALLALVLIAAAGAAFIRYGVPMVSSAFDEASSARVQRDDPAGGPAK